MRRHRTIWHRIDMWQAQQRRQAAMDDLEQVAETTREQILQYLQAHRDSLPPPMWERAADCNSDSIPEAHGARERLRQKLRETGTRLRRYMELRAQRGIK